ELALVGLVFLSLAYTDQQDGQVSTDIVTSRLPERVRGVIARITSAIFTVLVGVITYASWGRAIASYTRDEVRMGLLAWPVWPGRFLVAIGFTTLTIALLLRTFQKRPQQSTTPSV